MSVVSLSLCRAQIMQPLKMVLNIANIVRMFQVMGGQWENGVQVWITMELLQLYAPLCRISPMYSSCFLTNCRKCCIKCHFITVNVSGPSEFYWSTLYQQVWLPNPLLPHSYGMFWFQADHALLSARAWIYSAGQTEKLQKDLVCDFDSPFFFH